MTGMDQGASPVPAPLRVEMSRVDKMVEKARSN